MPGIYNALVSGIRQEYVPLFNLIFSLEIARKKATITDDEKTWFEERFTKLNNYWEWRLNNHKPSVASGFIKPESKAKILYA